MTIQNHYGNWLMSGGLSGEVVGNCCCGPEEVTTACSLEAPCAGGDPSMQVTVFDADYAGGSITFCGKTWTQAEVQAGKTECVCPTNYVDADPYGPPFTSLPSLSYRSGARQNWGFGTELNIDAFWEFPVTLLATLNAQLENRINVRNAGMVFQKARRHQYTGTNMYPAAGTTLGGVVSTTSSALGFIFSIAPSFPTGNASVATYGLKHPTLTKTTVGNTVATSPFSRTGSASARMNGRLDDGFFGRVTTTGGVTYSWKKGVGWP